MSHLGVRVHADLFDEVLYHVDVPLVARGVQRGGTVGDRGLGRHAALLVEELDDAEIPGLGRRPERRGAGGVRELDVSAAVLHEPRGADLLLEAGEEEASVAALIGVVDFDRAVRRVQRLLHADEVAGAARGEPALNVVLHPGAHALDPVVAQHLGALGLPCAAEQAGRRRHGAGGGAAAAVGSRCCACTRRSIEPLPYDEERAGQAAAERRRQRGLPIARGSTASSDV